MNAHSPFKVPLRLELLHYVKKLVVNIGLFSELQFNLIQIRQCIFNF
jgi:hypothetical protein